MSKSIVSILPLADERGTSERPVVLAELSCAHKAKKGVLVPIRRRVAGRGQEWQGLPLPADLEECISDWTLFMETRKRRGIAAKGAMGDRDIDESRHESTIVVAALRLARVDRT